MESSKMPSTFVVNLIIMSTLLFGVGYNAGKEVFSSIKRRQEIEDGIRAELSRLKQQ
jgi:hypothetical protein